MENIEYKGCTINIEQDECLESPREWDNLGKMICWHRRYNLGDESLLENWSESKECSLKNLTEYCNGWDEIEDVLKKEFNAVICLPLFLYDHSGISIRTYPHGQHAGWDGGYVGFIYATKADILKEYSVKKITKAIKAKVEKILVNEVEIYSQYLEGDVYYFKVEDEHGNDIDSCGGFYGSDEAIKEAKRIIDYHVQEVKKNLSPAMILG